MVCDTCWLTSAGWHGFESRTGPDRTCRIQLLRFHCPL